MSKKYTEKTGLTRVRLGFQAQDNIIGTMHDVAYIRGLGGGMSDHTMVK